ncbi:hypothetical protein [Allostreptomyces psammosilenae]|uniref:PIN domain-containing protein n=1 Tax=Allostreptomyces psammosilenae TaxID=1892865 RepID=A0A853A7Q4_9ACTN|nr:hypothetical protein [Allostreptomyces psammosilenae]NYI06691.1 hypothetical protein [Allostreptomyces psammosilenae]
MRNVVLDSGALFALECRDDHMLALAANLVWNRMRAYVPAGVVAQVWRADIRQPIARLLRSDAVHVDVLDEPLARRLGLVLASTRTSDVVQAHVALLARRLDAPVFTSAPEDIRALDATLTVVRV